MNKQLLREQEAFDQARRAILFNERPPKPPTELERLTERVADLEERLRLVAEVLTGDHECGGEW